MESLFPFEQPVSEIWSNLDNFFWKTSPGQRWPSSASCTWNVFYVYPLIKTSLGPLPRKRSCSFILTLRTSLDQSNELFFHDPTVVLMKQRSRTSSHMWSVRRRTWKIKIELNKRPVSTFYGELNCHCLPSPIFSFSFCFGPWKSSLSTVFFARFPSMISPTAARTGQTWVKLDPLVQPESRRTGGRLTWDLGAAFVRSRLVLLGRLLAVLHLLLLLFGHGGAVHRLHVAHVCLDMSEVCLVSLWSCSSLITSWGTPDCLQIKLYAASLCTLEFTIQLKTIF